jgi:hypothetical protein
MKITALIGTLSLALAAACGGQSSSAPAPKGGEAKAAPAADPHTQYAPLEAGADYESYVKMTKAPYFSSDHGKRFVEIYVNDVGAEAYKDDDAAFPVGTIIVKTSWEADAEGKNPTDVAGPIFVMEKKEAGFDDEHENWWYAMHWESIPEGKWQDRMKTDKVYWRTPSKRVKYCWECHENYDREVGLPPKEARAY